MKITDFFKSDYCNYSSYDNYRKIASYVDGLKPSARKTIHTIIKNNIKTPIKVSQLSSKIAEQQAYLHGEGSLFGVITGLAQDFVGANNIPLLKREGNFGSRLIQEPSAARYIFTCKEDVLDLLFCPEDLPVLIEQEFEGSIIEPRFFVPTLPLLAINGSEGISSGFAQKIFARNPKEVIQYIKDKLKGHKSSVKLNPWFRGFTGKVVATDEPGSYEIHGKAEEINTATVKVTELPIGWDLSSYIEYLNKLEDKGDISGYSDFSNEDKFEFEIKFRRETLKSFNKNTELLDFLKLIKRISENYTVLDENLKIKTYNSIQELLDNYIETKKEYLKKRKEYLASKLKRELEILLSKLTFIHGIITDQIVVNKKPEDQIISQLKKVDKIIEVDGSYSYLLHMPINSFTKEKLQALKDQIDLKKEQLHSILKKSIEDLWIDDIAKIERIL